MFRSTINTSLLYKSRNLFKTKSLLCTSRVVQVCQQLNVPETSGRVSSSHISTSSLFLQPAQSIHIDTSAEATRRRSECLSPLKSGLKISRDISQKTRFLNLYSFSTAINHQTDCKIQIVRSFHTSILNRNTNQDVAKVTAEHMGFPIRKAAESNGQNAKTLVVLFSYYGITEKAIATYCNVYHSYGFDVVFVKSYLKHFAWPKNSANLSKALLANLSEKTSSYDNIMIHAMSMGAYNFTLVMEDLYREPEIYGSIRNKIRAIVYDSMVIGSLKNMVEGVGRGASRNPLIQRLIPATMATYFYITYTHTVKVFDYYVDQFKTMPLEKPTLVFYAANDPMSEFDVLHGLMAEWKRKFTFPLVTKYWQESKHAAHLHTHKEEYQTTLDGFIRNIPEVAETINRKSKL